MPELLAAGYPVRCMARDPGKLSDRPWSSDIEIAAADALERTRVLRALEGVDVAYYLIHSLGTGASFEQRDRDAAAIFADAAMSAGVTRIVYLGGIIPGDCSGLSPHLRSRAEVGDVLLGSGVPTAALQAAVIIGSGSASFEMLRYLSERLPVMVTPKWVGTRIQPLAVHDVLRYLVGCAPLPPGVNRRFDIGEPDILTYAEMMRRYSEVAGLRPRVLLPVQPLTPRLSSLWVGLVTPVPADPRRDRACRGGGRLSCYALRFRRPRGVRTLLITRRHDGPPWASVSTRSPADRLGPERASQPRASRVLGDGSANGSAFCSTEL